jgi:hypothetical protein
MGQELAALGEGVAAMMAALDASGLRWQLGVTSAEPRGEQAGWLRGSPFVITPHTTDREALVADLLSPAVASGGEAGLAVALLALELAEPGGPNAGFRRAGAGLQVVFVSDSDDESALDDPEGALLARLEEEGVDSWARASALVGDVPSGCVSPRGSAQPGEAYVAVAEATGGVVASICDADFADVLQALSDDSVVLPTVFELSGVPARTEATVTVDGEAVDGWQLQLQPPAVVFDEAPPAGSVVRVSYAVGGS